MILKEGIVIKSLKYKDTSKIVYILTEEGLTSLLVKGAYNLKSKNFSYTQEITKIGYDTAKSKHQSFQIMTTGEVLQNYTNIKNDFTKMKSAFSVLEFTYQFHEHIENKQTLYQFLLLMLDNINEKESAFYPLIFQLKLLYLLGVGPTFHNCVDCGNRDDLIGFSFDDGGMVCKECAPNYKKLQVSNTFMLIKLLYLVKPNQINEVLETVFSQNESFRMDQPKYIEGIKSFLHTYYEKYLSFESKVNHVFKNM